MQSNERRCVIGGLSRKEVVIPPEGKTWAKEAFHKIKA